MNKATIFGALLTLGVVLLAVWAYWPVPAAPVPQPEPAMVIETPVVVVPTSTVSVIGKSVAGRDITAHTFGNGENDVLFVGGIHGGYEENTVRLAEGVIEEFQINQMVIPENVTVHIIPNLNPDGYAQPAQASKQARRFNGNDIDLNRNFDCRWAATSTWLGQTVSAGASAFSEPEAAALRDYVLANTPEGVVFWHSKGGAVFTSECGAGVLPGTETIMNTYATAAGYEAAGLWTAYPITGDAEGWLASIGIPAVTVELETRDLIEWTKNWAGVLATLGLYAD